ncbi:hypothetical protein HaLaN_20064, partial [Haematococcus lacustris]
MTGAVLHHEKQMMFTGTQYRAILLLFQVPRWPKYVERCHHFSCALPVRARAGGVLGDAARLRHGEGPVSSPRLSAASPALMPRTKNWSIAGTFVQ